MATVQSCEGRDGPPVLAFPCPQLPLPQHLAHVARRPRRRRNSATFLFLFCGIAVDEQHLAAAPERKEKENSKQTRECITAAKRKASREEKQLDSLSESVGRFARLSGSHLFFFSPRPFDVLSLSAEYLIAFVGTCVFVHVVV